MMKRILCMLMAIVVCASLAVPAYAANDTFVPSISYKDGPDIEKAEMDDENVEDCLVVTSISDAKHKRTDISQDARDLLLEVYQKLDDGSMKLPIANDQYVIRELVDVSWRENDCVKPDHDHEEWLKQDDTTLTVEFDLGVKGTTEVIVLVYVNNEWVPVENVVNNGDGTVTVVFEDICPVVFCIEQGAEVKPPKTGDTNGDAVVLWTCVLGGSLVALVIVLILFKRTNRKEHGR